MIRCNCENSHCTAGHVIRNGPDWIDWSVGWCPNEATHSPYIMKHVGPICTPCAESLLKDPDGARYLQYVNPLRPNQR